jgi:hypothetical protein
MKFLDFTSLLDTEPANLAALSTYQFDADFFERRLLRCSALLKARRILVFMDASRGSTCFAKMSGKISESAVLGRSCPASEEDGEIACHRSTVAELVLQAAKRRGEHVEIVEWPGGEPKQINLNVTPEVLVAVRKGCMTVPLSSPTWPWLLVCRGVRLRRSIRRRINYIASSARRFGKLTNGRCRCFPRTPRDWPGARRRRST